MYKVTLTNGERFIGFVRENAKNYIEFEVNDFSYEDRIFRTILKSEILVMRVI